MLKKPTLYIFMGYPGSGKTTVAKFIQQQTGAVHLWADQERQAMFANPTHSTKESQKLYNNLDIKAKSLLISGQSVIFDTNFNYFRDRELLRAIAKQAQAEFKLIWLTTAKETARERALHHTHRDKNGYMLTMTNNEFEHLTNHFEAPTIDEQPLKIDGAQLDYLIIGQQLGL